MKKIIILSALFLSSLLCSCEEEKLTMYEGEKSGRSGLFIQRIVSSSEGTNFESYADSSTNYSFVGMADSITFIDANIPIKVFGTIQPYDRPFILKVIPELCINAKEGVDFDIDKEMCVIPSGKSEVYVPIRLHRTPGLINEMATVVVEIEENQYFMIPFTTYRSENNPSVTNAKELSAIRYKLFATEIYQKPADWDNSFTNAIKLLGEWTPVKFNNLNVFMGWTIDDWDNVGYSNSLIRAGRMPYCALMFQKHLQALADSGNPVEDPDSEIGYVQLVEPYLVDYSKYGK